MNAEDKKDLVAYEAAMALISITKTNDFSVIQEALNDADHNTLIIFDVDDILFQPQDQILRSAYYYHGKLFEKNIDQTFSKKIADELYSIIWLQRKIESIDERFIPLVSKMQRNGLTVLALTNALQDLLGAFLL